MNPSILNTHHNFKQKAQNPQIHLLLTQFQSKYKREGGRSYLDIGGLEVDEQVVTNHEPEGDTDPEPEEPQHGAENPHLRSPTLQERPQAKKEQARSGAGTKLFFFPCPALESPEATRTKKRRNA
jgi:hypothetical protein